jgi:hypothetical protein
MRPNRPSARRGNVVTLVAVSLVLILGFVAVAIDGGMALYQRRNAFATADASAMAAACVLYNGYPNYSLHKGSLPTASATSAALAVAASNGFTNDGTHTVVTVNIPPASGLYQNKNGYAEVLVQYNQPRYFSAIFGSGTIPVTARAVARGAWVTPHAGVLILDYTDKASLNTQGNGAFTEGGGPVIVNSNNTSAMVDTGSGGMTAESFYVTGGVQLGNHANLTTSPTPDQIFEGVHPTPDPLAYLPILPVPPAGTMTTTSLGQGNTQYTLTPGTYSNLPTFNPGDAVILKQASFNNSDPQTAGIYYIDGGGFKSTGASITMDPTTTGGVMIYNSPQGTQASEKVQITGNSSGVVNLSPLADGPYTGMVLWQDRTSPVSMLVEGNGSFTVAGTFYAAGAMLNINGNGGTYTGTNNTIIQGSAIGSQYISNNLSLGGNGNINILYKGGLLARTRILTIVE